MPAGFISESWPASNRNDGRLQVGIPGRNKSESAFRDEVVIDTAQVVPPVANSYGETNSYGEFGHRSFSRPFYRPIGLEATTPRMNETVDTSVFERWRADTTHRPANLLEWEGLRLGALGQAQNGRKRLGSGEKFQ
ncbi:hypothetical protein QIH91_21020 [Bradyrhizobium japonicum USDA 135]|uniref:hypothetical protein n=1 Tax=Bradyrhizobium sp. USDA 241 TaxID=3377725 RepID=UPI003A66E640|nr:hypothetical protein QIH91_21020 [Bradyrhizobium japonicum USDA 135]